MPENIGAVSSINLIAKAAYGNVQSQSKLSSVQEAVSFQNAVKLEFEQLKKTSPQKISSNMEGMLVGRSGVSYASTNPGNDLQSALGSIKKELSKSENVNRKSLISDASILDIVTATNETTNVAIVMTELQKKFVDLVEKFSNLQV